MKKTICIVTGTRAEYHISYPLIRAVMDSKRYELALAVTGSHLHKEFGETYKDIEADGIPIAVKIPILTGNDEITDINTAISNAILGFDKYFKNNPVDLVFLHGDRYELLSVAIVAANYHIPIAHISGGETTEGAVDESIRHSITKMASIHFPCCDEYRKRIIQMGESPDRVFNVGDLGVENTLKIKRITKKELEKSLDFDLAGRFGVLTFHPVTLEDNTTEAEFSEILKALDCFPELKLILTKSNADHGGIIINRMIDSYVSKNPDRCVSVYSLGLIRYMTAISLADIVIGNSSSGIVETPSFKIPTVNIGDRQKGRIQAKNIINARPECEDIKKAMEKGLSSEFRKYAADTINPFGDGNATSNIMEKLDYFFSHPEVFPLKKHFYDVQFEI